jgi:branched-subunit amino acid ABC-type transport system permease component
MNLLDNFAHGLLVVLGAFSRFILHALEFVEGGFRALMHGAGLSVDVQTIVLIFILAMFLVGVLRLLGGRLRLIVSLILILILAHTLAGIGSGPLGGS